MGDVSPQILWQVILIALRRINGNVPYSFIVNRTGSRKELRVLVTGYTRTLRVIRRHFGGFSSKLGLLTVYKYTDLLSISCQILGHFLPVTSTVAPRYLGSRRTGYPAEPYLTSESFG